MMNNTTPQPEPVEPRFICIGYICRCGERVLIYKLEIGVTDEIPAPLTVNCKQGHVTNVNAAHVRTLQVWME